MSETFEGYTWSTSALNAIDDVADGESWNSLDAMRRFCEGLNTPGNEYRVTVERIEPEPEEPERSDSPPYLNTHSAKGR